MVNWETPFKTGCANTSQAPGGAATYVANVNGVPWGQLWKPACEALAASTPPPGLPNATFTDCWQGWQTGPGGPQDGEWGIFEAPDPSCAPKWTPTTGGGCVYDLTGGQTVSAQLDNVTGPWQAACQAIGLPADASFGGAAATSALVCHDDATGEFGSWTVGVNKACPPAHWGPLQGATGLADAPGPYCMSPGVGQYSAPLMGAPAGMSQDAVVAACNAGKMPPQVVGGVLFPKPTSCVKVVNDKANVWGQWDVANSPACTPSWGPATQQGCTPGENTGTATYSATVANTPASMSQTQVLEYCRTKMPPVTINGKTFATPTRCETVKDDAAGNVAGVWDGVPDFMCYAYITVLKVIFVILIVIMALVFGLKFMKAAGPVAKAVAPLMMV